MQKKGLSQQPVLNVDDKIKINELKKLLSVALLALGLVSCSEDTIVNNYDITVENVTVEFGAKSLLTESSDVLAKGTPFDNSYTHVLPTNFKAYFISSENRGQYSVGQVVKVVDVSTGNQLITIPKLSYTVYVTNHIKNDGTENQPYAWYTWQSPQTQLPVTTPNILLFGKNVIDYKTVTQGTVTLENFHAAVMIKKTEALSSTTSPFFNTGNVNYNLVANNTWYLLYIRNATTSSQVPLAFNVSGVGNVYQLNKPIEANKIYQYVFHAVDDVDGNLEIITVPLEEGLVEDIDLFP